MVDDQLLQYHNSSDKYVTEGALNNRTSPDWTLEQHLYIDASDAWETIVGRRHLYRSRAAELQFTNPASV